MNDCLKGCWARRCRSRQFRDFAWLRANVPPMAKSTNRIRLAGHVTEGSSVTLTLLLPLLSCFEPLGFNQVARHTRMLVLCITGNSPQGLELTCITVVGISKHSS
jgi:hypothetical protein